MNLCKLDQLMVSTSHDQLQWKADIVSWSWEAVLWMPRKIVQTWKNKNESSKRISTHCVSTVSKWRGKSLFVLLCKSFFLDAEDVDSLGRFCAKRETLPSILLHVHFAQYIQNIFLNRIFKNIHKCRILKCPLFYRFKEGACTLFCIISERSLGC